ncbi:MAG: excinuclease ABC subunit UvrA [Flavobacteriales bacterium]|nr:excinuclease ABC subunit UvrA [Flavobacteriales bacterium]
MKEFEVANETEYLEVIGARTHNLKNIDVKIPRNQLVVFTGLSGSGKSSLAFDTIYAEGQRRYIETFSSYARQFLNKLDRPDVDKISGLSPVISIEQKSVNKNPRSTVGTITEIYDFFRLLYARAGEAYSYETGEKMLRYSERHIHELIIKKYDSKEVLILAAVVKGRKGHYRDLFEKIMKQGFLKVRVDGEVIELTRKMQLDRFKIHDIEIVVDRIIVEKRETKRITDSIQLALNLGNGLVNVLDVESGETQFFSKFLMCPTTGISYKEPAPNLFSFNTPYGACPKCNGLGEVSEIDIKKIIPDDSLSIKKGAVAPIGKFKNSWIFKQIEAVAEKYEFTLDTPFSEIPENAVSILLYGADEVFKVKEDLNTEGRNYMMSFEGIVSFIVRHNEEVTSNSMRKWMDGFMNKVTCSDCGGARLNKEALHFKIADKNIAELATMDLNDLSDWLENLEDRLTDKQNKIATEVLKEIRARIKFILDVGLNYLQLNRSSKSLSGGEAQRIRLATQIGSLLVNVLYILDEPSIGLHQRDNNRLIDSLKKLRDIGNSVIVVEHDKDMILAADYIVDIGPRAGRNGGMVVAEGDQKTFLAQESLTSDYIKNVRRIEVPKERRAGSGEVLSIKGASGNNLKNIDVDFPLGKLICVTGVSGSGKSTLVNETLYPILNQFFYRSHKKPMPYDKVAGIEHVDKVIQIDQSPIGRTPRSNPATYTGVFSEIRNLMANLPESKIRGYKPGRFSFNVKDGRCETCRGAGLRTIEMNLLPDVYVKCENCNGNRYNEETLEIKYKGKSISEILNLNIGDATDFFENIPYIKTKLNAMREVGLEYITLGQQSTTLSGGEAQRVKLATELAKRDTGNTFYILDEPTTGLHFEDIRILLEVLTKLANSGNTVLIVEHNLDIIKMADHIIDIGPEGGRFGGEVLYQGVPEGIGESANSHTARYLLDELKITNNSTYEKERRKDKEGL